MLREFIQNNSDFLIGARIQKIQQPTRKDFVLHLRNNAETRKLYINIHPQFYHVCFMFKSNEQKRLIEIPQKPPMFCMLLRKYLENAKISKVNQPEYERILEIFVETYNEFQEKIYLCLSIELMGKHSNVILYNYDTNIIIGSAHNVGEDKSKVREIFGGLPYVYPQKSCNFWYESEITDIDSHYADLIYNDKFSTKKHKYLQIVQKKLHKNENKLEKLSSKTIDIEKTQKYKLYGDLVLANLFNNNDFSSKITVFDYTENKNVEIELDSTKTLKENANNFYKLYNKSKSTNEKTTLLIEELNMQIEYLKQILYSIDIANTIEELNEIEFEVSDNGRPLKVEKNSIYKIADDDYTIFVGKNNKQNDYIVSKLAKDDDLWFHVHNIAGSHVLLKSQKITDELILKCAKLAKEFSSGANSSKIGVIYTKAKYLKKPPKANLGYVTYSNEKEIILD